MHKDHYKLLYKFHQVITQSLLKKYYYIKNFSIEFLHLEHSHYVITKNYQNYHVVEEFLNIPAGH